MIAIKNIFLSVLLIFCFIPILRGQGENVEISTSGSTVLCPGLTIKLSVNNATAGSTFQWVKDGNDIIGAKDKDFTVSTPGIYNVKVNGTLLTAVTISSNTSPNSNFSFSPTGGCGKTKISFTNSSTNGQSPSTSADLQYLWQFGDGKTSSVKDPSYVFSPGGGTGNTTFDVRLIVTNAAGCKDTSNKPITIQKGPDATLLSSATSDIVNGEPYFKICSPTGQRFEFRNGSTTNSKNTNYIIRWGDGSPDFTATSFNSPITHDYPVGIKKLTYIVYAGTCIDSTVYNIFVGNIPAGGITGTGGSTICSGSAQKFLISGVANNPEGTIYLINYNDGSNTDTFYHPAPAEITHSYFKNSCGTSSSSGQNSFPNAFGTYLTISNPCGTASGSIVPIYVSDKPIADFRMENDSICVDDPIYITNTGKVGDNVQSGSCTTGKIIWRISSSTPGATWTLIDGNLGNSDGSINPNFWLPGGSNRIRVRFTKPGVYSITQIAANNTLCGADSITKTVCVNPAPTASFTVDKVEGCAPLKVSVSGSTNSALCGTNTFEYSVSYKSNNGCSPGNSAFTYTDGTDQNSKNPKIEFTNPGEYIIRLRTIAPGKDCYSSYVETTVTVKGKPVIAIDASSNGCEGSVISPTATVSCFSTGATYSWTFTGGTPSTSTQLSPGKITYSRLGNYNIEMKATNECGSNSTTKVITISEQPTVSIPDNIVVCEGQEVGPINFTTTVTGTTLSWTNNETSIGLTSSGNGNIAKFIAKNNTANPIVATVSVTPKINSCSGDIKAMTITVNPLPLAPSVTTPQSICLNETALPLTATAGVGNKLIWYSQATGGIGNETAPTPSTTISGTTNYYVSQRSAAGCEGPRSRIEVIVGASPTFSSQQITLCSGDPFDFKPSGAPNGTIYKWGAPTLTTGLIGGAAGSGSSIKGEGFKNNTLQSQKAIYTISAQTGKCAVSLFDLVVNVTPIPDASFTLSTKSGCGPLAVTFNNTSISHNTLNYFWDFGNGKTSSLYQPGQIIFLPNSNFGDTSYTVTLSVFNNCDTAKFTATITVQSAPLSRFTPSKTVGCSPLTVTFNNTSRGVNNSYIWNFGDGSAVVPTPDTRIVSRTYLTGVRDTFLVSLISVNGCGRDTADFNIIVTPNTIKLDVAVNGLEQNGCVPHTVRFINNSTGASVFQWDFGDGNQTTSTKNKDTITHTFISSGVYNVKLTASNSCSDTTTTEEIEVFSKPNADFSSSVLSACIGDSIRFYNKATGGASSYLWRFGDGNSTNVFSASHQFKIPGLYSVTLTAFKTNTSGNICKDSITRIIKITDSLPVNFEISDSFSTCAPFKVQFANTFTDYSFLEWDFGDGQKASGDKVEHLYKQKGIFYARLTLKTKEGCVYTSLKKIEIASPDGTVRMQTGYNCFSTSVRFEAIPINTDSIIWDFGDGKLLHTTSRVVYHNYQNPGTYYPIIKFKSISGCEFKIPDVNEIKIDKIIPGFRYEQQMECGKTSIRFTDTSNVFFGKLNVKWNLGDGTSLLGGIVTHSYTMSKRYIIQQIVTGLSGCADTLEIPIDVSVRSIPDAQVDLPELICSNTTVTFRSTTQSNEPIAINNWRISNGISMDKQDVQLLFTTPGNYSARFISGTQFGCFDTVYRNFNVNSTPIVKTLPDITICKGSSVTLSSSGANEYTWYPNDGLSCVQCTGPISNPLFTTSYVVKGKSDNGCFAFDTILVKVIQPFKINVTPGDSICIGQSMQLMASGAVHYQWTPTSGLNNSTISNPLAQPQSSTNYRVIGSDELSCFSDTAFVMVGVGQYPVVDLGPDLTLSTGTLLEISSTITNGPIRKWTWSPGTDLNCTTCPKPTATIKKNISYTVNVINAYDCPASDTLNIKVFCNSSQVYIPNSFSPDGDGLNDIFMVRASGIMQVKSFRIYSRWGELVFEKTNIKPNDPLAGWDGRVKGVIMGPDVYAYTAEVICDNGTPYFMKGNVTLLR